MHPLLRKGRIFLIFSTTFWLAFSDTYCDKYAFYVMRLFRGSLHSSDESEFGEHLFNFGCRPWKSELLRGIGLKWCPHNCVFLDCDWYAEHVIRSAKRQVVLLAAGCGNYTRALVLSDRRRSQDTLLL
ncbi:hypothetical protein A0H81_01727 [Grifola frondosa]|uniref:Uncharacterized protein n=1 Tax=Grifola frondosa TaxID=5627 RepID=A0A1C7MLY0_GRIFR|nr:hypothetical protein A0H81_01727 [Grifola frondosa]